MGENESSPVLGSLTHCPLGCPPGPQSKKIYIFQTIK